MAENIERDAFAPLNLGITNTTALGNPELMDKFLSGSDDIEEIDESEEEEEETEIPTTKKPVAKKPVVVPKKKEDKKKEDPPKVEEVLFNENESEEEEEEEEDEKEEVEEENEETQEEEEENKDTKDGNPYEGLAKDLIKLGIFTQDSDKDPLPKTGEELLAKFQTEGQKVATTWLNNFLSQFGEDRHELFQAIFMSGVDPKEYLPLYNQVESFKNLDIADEKNQQKVYREFFRRQGLSDEKIESRLQRTIDYGFLEDESKDYLEQILAQDEEAKTAMEEAETAKRQAEAAQDAEYKTAAIKLLEEKFKERSFNGIPLTEDMKRKTFDFIYTKKYKAGNQKFTEFDRFIANTSKPENIEERLMIALLKLNNFDFSKIVKKEISKQSDELFSSLTVKKIKSKKSPTKNPSLRAWNI